ncbi:protoheme IX farnesyltransferase [Acidobacteriota bacterium]
MTEKANRTAPGEPATQPPDRLSRSWLRTILELCKVPVTFGVILSAACGYFLFAEKVDPLTALAVLGVFLLACGASALNQVQEVRIDARMERTRLRPVPSGRLDPFVAVFIAVILILAGLYVLTSVDRHTTVLLALALFAVIWYNLVYTYLKRITAFAVVVGSLVGAAPPLMGWAAAGGDIRDPAILLVALFMIIWQIPHFWLLVLMRGKEYERAGLPSPSRVFTQIQLARITFMWILAAVCAGFLTFLLMGIGFPWILIVLAASVWLITRSSMILRHNLEAQIIRSSFFRMIGYLVVVLVTLSLQALL